MGAADGERRDDGEPGDGECEEFAEQFAALVLCVGDGNLSMPERYADAAVEACYWGDLSFGPHLLNLFSKRCIHARAVYAVVTPEGRSRKDLGATLHAQVCALAKPWA